MHADFNKLTLNELRQMWLDAWGIEPHAKIGRTMLEKSLSYKLHEQNSGGLPEDINQRIQSLIKSYRRNKECFDQYKPVLKPGTRLVKNWSGNRYSVLILKNGEFEYKDKIYKSLSQIAFDITGTRWNGWVFFGFKNRTGKSK